MKMTMKKTVSYAAALSVLTTSLAMTGAVYAVEQETEVIINSTFDTGLDGWDLMANNSGNRISCSDGKIYTSIVGCKDDDVTSNDWLADYNLGSTRGAAFRPDDYKSYMNLTDYTLSIDFGMDDVEEFSDKPWNAALAADILLRQNAEPNLAEQTYAEGYLVKVFSNRVALYDSSTKKQLDTNSDMNYYPLTLGKEYNIKSAVNGNKVTVDIALYTDGVLGSYKRVIDYTDERENRPTAGGFMIVNKIETNNASYYKIPPVNNYTWFDNIKVEAPVTELRVAADMANGATGVELLPTVLLSFNSAVDGDALAAALTVTDNAGAGVTPKINVSADGKQAELTFAEKLEYRTKYTVTIPQGFESKSGLALANEYTLQFTTASKTSTRENVLTTTFDNDLDGWAQVSGLSGNRVSWADGRAYTTIVSRDADDYSQNTGALASNRAAGFRPINYEQYNNMSDYRISMDFELTENIKIHPQMFGLLMYLRVTGEPNVGAQTYPSGYCVRFYNGSVSLLDNKTGKTLSDAAYKLNQSTVYNAAAEVIGDTVNVYAAEYTNGVLGEYVNILSYTDERDEAPEKGYFLVSESLVYNYQSAIYPTEDAMWLDNIVVDEYITDLTVSSDITDGETGVSTDKEITLYFNSAVDADVLKNNLEILNTDRNEAVTAYTVTADESGKVFTISFTNPLANRTNYSIRVFADMPAKLDITLPTDCIITFKTEEIEALTENLITSAFDSDLSPWAMVMSTGINKMEVKNGVVSTSIGARSDDGVPPQYSDGPLASPYATFLRPTNYDTKYQDLQNYSVSMDFNMTNTYGSWMAAGMFLRVHGEPVYAAAQFPKEGGYQVIVTQGKLDLNKLNSEGHTDNLRSIPFTVEYGTTYNLKTVANENTIKVYIAKYTGGVLDAYDEVISYTDENNPALSGYFMVYENLSYNNNALNFMPTNDVAWIDNVVVDKIITPFYVDSTSVANNAQNVSKSAQIAVTFSSPVTAEAAAAGIELKDNTLNSVIPSEAYTLTADGKTVTLAMNNDFVYNHTYTIICKEDLEDIYGTPLSLYQGGAYNLTFTIEPENVYIKTINVTDINGGAVTDLASQTSLKVSAEIYNKASENKPVWLIAAAFGDNNQMLRMSETVFDAGNGSTKKELTIDNIPLGTKSVRVFAWNSKTELIPYCMPGIWE